MFRLVKIENGRTNEAEPVKLGATPQETYTLGEALVLSGGLATKCAPTTKPAFIAGEDFTAPAAGSASLVAYPISSDMVFEVPVTAAPTSLKAGNAVTLSSDGLGVTATTTSGVAFIRDLTGATTAGDKILVKF